MTQLTEITEVKIRLVPDARDGLLAYAACRYGDVILNDIAIRRDETGRLYLTFPRKLSSTGHPHPIHFPMNRETAAAFEGAILGRLREMADGLRSTGAP